VASAAGSGHAAGSSCWGCPGIGRPAAMETGWTTRNYPQRGYVRENDWRRDSSAGDRTWRRRQVSKL